MATPFEATLVATLEGLIAPGGRARLSSYVEAAQCEVLCGRAPDIHRHHEDIQNILRASDARIARLAEEWVEFNAEGKRFTRERYATVDFLDAYLAYYCTTNVAKVQLSLLDLVTRQALPSPSLNVVDVGVGTGTTLLGLMDFLLAWATVCDLYGVTFPIETVTFTGLDCAKSNLEYARRVAAAYAGALRRRREISADPIMQARLEAMEQWVGDARWILHDLNEQPYSGDESNLVIASNVFNELKPSGRKHLEDLLASMQAGGIGIVIEPGARTNAEELMRWRRTLIEGSERLTTIGPCGTGPEAPLGVACDKCWNGRRESLHQPALYRSFRMHAAKLQRDGRSFDDFENDLLSWSYVLLQATPHTKRSVAQPIRLTDGAAWPPSQPLTFIGAFRSRNGVPQLAPVEPDAERAGAEQREEVIKFCAGGVANKHSVSLQRHKGIQLPRLQYGETVTVSDATCTLVNSEARIQPGPETKVHRSRAPLGIAETFLPEYTPQVRRAIDEIAYRLFGFKEMKPFQHQILSQSLTGRSVLGIAATGGGKSECYILPAMLLPGITVVVSPLKSLMMDQYEQRICKRYGLGSLTTVINGDVPFAERQARLRRIELGHYKLVYMTPEQLERGYVLDSLRRADQLIGIRYLALDEAHCISQWGHDFRSSYLNMIQRLRSRHIQPVRIALTATASPEVRQDLCEELQLDPRPLEQGGDLFIESSNRPELNLVVRVHHSTDEKVDQILDDLRQLREYNRNNEAPGAAIVFMPYTGGKLEYTAEQGGPERGRRSPGASNFASYLERTLKERVAVYHSKMGLDSDAGEPDSDDEEPDSTTRPEHRHSDATPLGDLSGRSRRDEQRAFIEGERAIMVATKGFGMGIDKPNIRLVIHRSPPGNLEAYAQEAGRAGRDGEPATVILYYSPDKPVDENQYKRKVHPSDDEIQRRFLADKYIRREDVLVMRAFLRSAQRRVAGRIYVTNDEAIAFFDRCMRQPQLAGLPAPYTWPEWPEREPEGTEYDEHRDILEKGYTYQQKTQYLKRILDVLYRIRPNMGPGSPREAMVEECRRVGAVLIKPYVRNAKAILESNAYFGAILRDAGLSADELKRFLRAGDLLKLADRLRLPLSDIKQLVSDISQLQFSPSGSQRDNLLDYKFIEAPHYGPAAGKKSLADWRSYAGARRRAKDAYERARKAGRPVDKKGRPQPTLDDWFWWSELNKSQGWEIAPGPALERDKDFNEYLDAFMALHDNRQRNDWAAYHRLLTDYVGVEADGTIGPQTNKLCLRAVLLGYLKTYEVIVGESCLSCSRCVPDEQFTASLEERKRVVARMSEELEQLFGAIERHASHFPDRTLIETLLTAVRREQATGRSLVAYLQGWTNRLLIDTPDHRGALVIRAAAMIEGLMEVQHDDLLALIQNLIELATNDELVLVTSLVEQAWHLQPESTALCRHRISLARRQNHVTAEAQAWEDLLGLYERQEQLYPTEIFEACAALTELYAPNGPLHDQRRHEQFALRAARYAQNRDTASQFYLHAIATRDWNNIVALVHEAYRVAWGDIEAPLLLGAWLTSDIQGRAMFVAEALSQGTISWEQWPAAELQELVARIPDAVLAAYPTLAVQLITHLEAPTDIMRVGRLALTEKARFPSEAIRALAMAALSIAPLDRQLLEVLHVGEEAGDAVYETLQAHWSIATWDDAVWLLAHFSAELLRDIAEERLRRLREAVVTLPDGESRQEAARQLQPLATSLLGDPAVAEEAHPLWQQACVGCSDLALAYFGASLREPGGVLRIQEFLDLLAMRSQATRGHLYSELKRRWEFKNWRTLQLWLAWFTPEICAEPPRERVHLVFAWSALLTADAPRDQLIAAMRPILMPLLGDAAVSEMAHRVWQRICVSTPEAIADYVAYCDASLEGDPHADHFLGILHQHRPDTHRIVARLLRPTALTSNSLTELRRWYDRFAHEICAEAFSERLAVLERSIELLLADTELSTIPTWLRNQATELFAGGLPTETHTAYQSDARCDIAASARYALLCLVVPGGRTHLTDFVGSLGPGQREARQVIYRIEKVAGLPSDWEELETWMTCWTSEICAETLDEQLRIVDHALSLLPAEREPATAWAVFGAPLRVLMRNADLLPEGTIARLQAWIPNLDELVYRTEDPNIITAYPQLLRAWLQRHLPRILAEPPEDRLRLLTQYIDAIPAQGELRTTIAEYLQSIAVSLFTVEDPAIVAETHRQWRRVCEELPVLIPPYLAAGAALPPGPLRDHFFGAVPHDPVWLSALYSTLRPSFAPQNWEDFTAWLDRFAPIEESLPAEERLELLRLGIPLLPASGSRSDTVLRLQRLAEALARIPSVEARAHQLWQDVCASDKSLFVRYVFLRFTIGTPDPEALEWMSARLRAMPELRERLHEELRKRPGPRHERILTMIPGALQHAPLDLQLGLLRSMRTRVLKQHQEAPHVSWLLSSFQGLLTADDPLADEAHRLMQDICLTDEASIPDYLDICKDLPAGDTYGDMLLKRLLTPQRAATLAQLTRPLPYRRWNLAVRMARVLVDAFGPNPSLARREVTKEHLTRLSQVCEPRRNEEYADMLVAALSQVCTWTRPTYLTPLTRLVEALVQAGRRELALRLAASHPQLQVGRNREPAAAYIARAESARRDDLPMNPDYATICACLLGTGPYTGGAAVVRLQATEVG